MKKYLNYIIILVVLLIVTLILFLKEKPGTLKVANKVFAVADTSVVTSIRFSNGKSSVQLSRVNGGLWKVNQQFNAKPHIVKTLLGLLTNIEISAPVSKSMKTSVMKGLHANFVSVVFESSGKTLKAYKVTETDSLRIGSFMMMLDGDEPYLVHVPGYNGRISVLFPCDEQFWRDKSIFSYRPQDILSIEVEYPEKPHASFIYQFLGPNDLEIKSLHEKSSVKISKEAARVYLNRFTNISYEAPVRYRTSAIFDSISHQKPYCEIRVKNAENQVNILRTYQISVGRERNKFDVDRMYAVHQNDTVPVIIKYIDIDPVMKVYSDFLVK
jgi:hypothetical protein